MLKLLWYFLCLIFLLSESSSGNMACNHPNLIKPRIEVDTTQYALNEKPYTKVNFAQAALRGAKEVEMANSYQAITKDTTLRGIYFHSSEYKEEVRQFLASPNNSTDQKIVTICLIQDLGLEDYLETCNYTATLYKEYKIEEEVLMWVIAPNFNRMQIIARNYENPAVISTLKKILTIKRLSRTTKRVIYQILSGDETKFL